MARGNAKTLTVDLKERVLEAYREGIKRDEIRKRTGISNGSLTNILKEYNEPRRNPKITGVAIDLTGETYHRLKVIERDFEAETECEDYSTRWRCECQGSEEKFCGKIVTVSSAALRNGTTYSCGCLHSELASARLIALNKENATHGETGSTEWLVWKGMVDRCHLPTNKDYSSWGGRGIRVCDGWRYDSKAFLDYIDATIGRKPPDKDVIDRIDNDGHYEPGNIRWATHTESARNRRNNVLLTHDGRTQCVAAWAEEARATGNTSLGTTTLYTRVITYKWVMEEALTRPVDQKEQEEDNLE